MGFDLLKMKNSLTSSFLLKACDSSALNDALAFAKASLHTESLENHPDYLFISSCGKKTIGVDDVLPLIRKCSFPPVVADKIMVIIDDMEKLTVAAQNKLLLLLEENTHCFVIGIVHEDGLLLDTVKSRMRLLSYKPLNRRYFMEKHSLSDKEAFFYYISEGNEENFHKLYAQREMFSALRDSCFFVRNRSQILNNLHLVKEKDKMAVTEDRVLMRAVLMAMQYFFTELALELTSANNAVGAVRCTELCNILSRDIERCMYPTYTKDDFFQTIILCVELKEGK